MEFLELIETISPDEASPTRLYNGIGRRAQARETPEYRKKFDECRKLVERVLHGSRYAALLFEEAMSTDDFPLLFGDVIDRVLLRAYQEFPVNFGAFADTKTVRDFREVKRYAIDGSESTLGEVPQGGEYPESDLSETEYSYSVKKYGRALPLLWETLINDDLDAFRDIPVRFGRAARRSEVRFVTELYVDENGPHASLYTAGNNNIISGNPALSTEGVASGIETLLTQTDTEGEPIMIDAITLVVTPALKVEADRIVNTTEYRVDENGNTRIVRGNGLGGTLAVVVDPYIPLVASSANGSATWALFADPNVSRPALEFGRLRGHESPEIWVKTPDAQRVGGGDLGPDQGDFETDSVRYRVRHVFGGTRVDPKATVASNGSGA